MKIEARFATKAPETLDHVQRFVVAVGGMEIEVSVGGSTSDPALMLRVNRPFGEAMIVVPQATNGVAILTRKL